MDPKSLIILAVSAYKISSLWVGALFGYLGYKLFIMGIWGNAGTLQASYNNKKILLRGAAPGTFFIVLGAIVIGITLFKGFDTSYSISPASRPTLP
jgi:hypothetical protein